MKRFVVFQVIGLVLYAAYLAFVPKNCVASAEIQVTDRLPSLYRAGNYATPLDAQFTGTVGRGFQDERVAAAVATKHPELHVSAGFIREHLKIAPNRLNRTIRLFVEADSPAKANAILGALIKERRETDFLVYQENKAAALNRVTQRVEELQAQLTRGYDQIRARSVEAGDPVELAAQKEETQMKAAVIEQARLDFRARAAQLRNEMEFLDAAIEEARAGKLSPSFAGFEVFDSAGLGRQGSGLFQSSLDGHKRDSGIAEAWTAVLRATADLAIAQSVSGAQHPRTRKAAAKLIVDRARLLAALSEQRDAIRTDAEAMAAGSESLGAELALTQRTLKKLAEARFDPDYLRLRQTTSGLANAYREAVVYRQALLSAGATFAPLFTVTEPPLNTDLPVVPAPLPSFVAAEIATLFLFWLTTPCARRSEA